MGTSNELADRVKEGLSERYRLERELGRGGMATVFLARDLAHDRLVAIKVVHDDVAAGITAERFLREIRLLAALQHPNILPLHDSGVIGGTPYYVMPYVAGESLRDRLVRDRTLPLSLALRITVEAAAALDYAHRQDVVHRDIKPENILLSDEHVIIADFGIARAAAQSADDKLTATSVVIGTPAYMSPEQASGEIRLDGRSDVYSLACVLFEMLAGQSPFTGSTTLGVVASRFRTPAPHVSSLRADVPKHVDAALASALAISPDDRPESAGAFAAMLTGDAAPPRRPRAFRWRAVIAGSALALLIGAAGFLLLRATGSRKAAAAQQASVAVLPLESSGQAGDEYFASGMTDELISALATVDGLHVAAKAATLAAAQSGAGPADLGRKLGVRTLLTGSIRRQGDSLRVTTQLTDASSGYIIRSFKIDRSSRDVFAVQEEIARMITGALAVDLGGRGSRPIVARHTTDIEAHDLYLQGRYFMDRVNGSGLLKALELFRAAIKRDSLYAQAWAGMADVHSSRGIGNAAPIPPRPEFEQARIEATKALALDSTLAEAHAALALVQMMYDFDWPGAAQSLDLAQHYDPGYADTYLYRGFLLSWLGKFDAATSSTREGLHMNPASFRFGQDIARTLLLARRFPEAEQEIHQVLALDSTNGRGQMLLGDILLASGKSTAAVSELEQAQKNLPATRVAAFRAAAYERAGRHSDALALADSLTKLSERTFMPAQDLAIAWAGLHDANKALTWLERAYDDRTLRPFVRDPVFDFLIGEPRYRGLFTRLRLPPPAIPVLSSGR